VGISLHQNELYTAARDDADDDTNDTGNKDKNVMTNDDGPKTEFKIPPTLNSILYVVNDSF